ncbi:MAG: hypothetical protein GY697_24735 [Desulfobacterales bacterium]|nr:hypothetical protein [Desulfobacterales bacterium]
MTDENRSLESGEKLSIIQGVKTPLGFFVLTVLIGEGGLIAFAAKADGIDRTIGIVGMILLLFASGTAVYLLAAHRPKALNLSSGKEIFSESLSFDRVMVELSQTIEVIEKNAFQRAKYYRDQGDTQRLLDGLYSAALYASGAVPTGRIEPFLYGNLMEMDNVKKALRVRYFKGPYNDEIICRMFPLQGPKQGVASEAVNSNQIQYRNEMGDELKERGESLLKAMVSIPVPIENMEELMPGMIVAINIDSIQKGVFPIPGKSELYTLEKRAKELSSLVERINNIREEIIHTRDQHRDATTMLQMKGIV